MNITKNIALYSIAGLMFWVVGYNLMYEGVDKGWIGTFSSKVIPSPDSDPGDYRGGNYFRGKGADPAFVDPFIHKVVPNDPKHQSSNRIQGDVFGDVHGGRLRYAGSRHGPVQERLHAMHQNIALYSIAGLMFWVVGYNLMYEGVDKGWIGTFSSKVIPPPIAIPETIGGGNYFRGKGADPAFVDPLHT